MNLNFKKKQFNSEVKAKIDAKDSEISLLSNNISTEKEYVSKTCDCLFDFKKGTKTYFYDSEKVGEEKMRPEDYQITAELKNE